MIHTLSQVAKDDTRATLLTLSMVLFMLCGYSLLFLSGDPMLLRLLTLAYLGGTTMLGAWLYITNPGLFLGFAWWVWFITPLVRRVVDYQLDSFTPPKAAFILLAPYVVTSLTVFDLPRYGRLLLQKSNLPFLLCFLGVLYGYLVGLPASPMGATIDLLNWLCPLLLGFRMVALWRLYPRHKRITVSVFTWAVLLLGLYGVVQFFVVPPWDAFWMTGSGMNSIGKPVPFEIRVFGTMDSAGPFAMFLMAGLVILFGGSGVASKLAILPGFIAFLLTIVRGAWGGWVLAVGYVAARARRSSRAQLIGSILLALVITIPLAMTGEIGDRTETRMQSFTEMGDDGSLNARRHMYQEMTGQALLNPIGEGLGGRTFDSGIINALWLLGWPGGFLYLAGLFLIVKDLLMGPVTDKFATLAGGVALSYAALMLMATQTGGMKGCIFWSFVALVMASRRYYAEEERQSSSAVAPSDADARREPAVA
jgi:hypothetical protein